MPTSKSRNPEASLALDIMLSKGAYTGSHFESIQIKDGFAFNECGAVRSGKKLASKSSVTKISADQETTLLTALRELKKQKTERGVSWPTAESGEGFFDAGAARVSWHNSQNNSEAQLYIETNLSAVKESERVADKLLNDVVTIASNLSTTPCKESSLFR